MKPNIGDFIKGRINELPKMSFRKLEILSGVSKSEISYIINRKRKKTNPEILKAIAPHLKVKYEYLLFLSGYLSEESWEIIEQGLIKRREKDDLTKEKVSETEELYHSLGLLSAEEKDMLSNFRTLKDKKAKSFLNYFMKLALKAG